MKKRMRVRCGRFLCVKFSWCRTAQCRVRSPLVAVGKPSLEPGDAVINCRIFAQVYVLVFYAPPQPFDEHAVHPPALPVHADRDALFLQRRAVAEAFSTKVRGREDDLLPAWCERAICLRDQGKFQEALEFAQRAENLQKKDRRLTKLPSEEVVKLREEIEADLRRY